MSSNNKFKFWIKKESMLNLLYHITEYTNINFIWYILIYTKNTNHLVIYFYFIYLASSKTVYNMV